jgi:hypothetical protein
MLPVTEYVWCENIRKRHSRLLGKLAQLECPSGWEIMIDQLCLDIIKHEVFFSENPDYTPVNFVQIKEKFGGLRAYYEGGKIKNEYIEMIRIIVRKYEDISTEVCSFCGSFPAKLTVKNRWIHPVCSECEK